MSTPEHAKSAIAPLDPATGMKLGQRYRVEPTESGHAFEGFFLDGKYFLNADLLTAVGWLEGRRFIYDQVDGKGEPVFAERHAGDISELNLTVVDGPVLALTPMDEIEDRAEVGSGEDEPSQAADADAHGSQQKRAPAERATGQPDETADADDSGKPGENEGTNDEREASGGDDGADADDADDADNADGTDDARESDKSESSACPISQSTNLLLTGIAGLAIGLLIGVSIGRHDR